MQNRFLVEANISGSWKPFKLLTRSPTIRHALDRLNVLTEGFCDSYDTVRIRRLNTHDEVFEAKREICHVWGVSHVET